MINIFILAGGPETPKATVPLSKAIEETLHVKRWAGRRERYIKSLRQYLNQFARGRESMPVSALGVEEIQEWFMSRNESPVSRSSNLGRLSAMFQVCWRRGYITENPCRRIERASFDPAPPKILTMRQVMRALIFTLRRQGDFLGWLSLALLAGLRPEEADRISWNAIDFERGEVRIDACASKVRRRRIVTLTPAAREWLRLANHIGAVLPMSHSTRRRRLRRLREALHFESWPQDILRHTAASYLLAHVGDAGKVAMQLGNSASILGRHYKELVTTEDGARFAALSPSRISGAASLAS